MARKSVIDVEVNDKAFREFSAMFDKYEQANKKQRDAWAATGKNIDKSRKSFGQLVDQMVAQNKQQKVLVKAQAEADRRTHSMADHWRDMARSTRSVAANIGEATKSLLKWTALTGVFTGVLGSGGLFGIDRMAAGVASGRRSSMGLGLSYGEQKSFGVNYGRLVDTGSFLSGVNQSLSDMQSRSSLIAAGVTDTEMRGSTAQVGTAVLRHYKDLADRSNPAMLGDVLRSHGGMMDLEDFKRLRATPRAEVEQLINQAGSDNNAMGLDPKSQKAWQDFITQLDRASTTIENVFNKQLAPLADPLSHLSDAIVKAVTKFDDGGMLDKAIGAVGRGIEYAADYLGSDKFQSDLRAVVDGIAAAADKLGDSMLGRLITGDSTPSSSGGQAVGPGGGNRHNPLNVTDFKTGLIRSFPTELEGQHAGIDQLARDIETHHQNTLRQLIYGNAEHGGWSTTDRAAYLKNVSSWTGIGPDQTLDIHNNDQFSSVYKAFRRQEGNAPPAVVVRIQNETGGNVVVSTSQAAQ